MFAAEMKPGEKVVVAEFAENPLEAVEKYMSITVRSDHTVGR